LLKSLGPPIHSVAFSFPYYSYVYPVHTAGTQKRAIH
jgi:hypothetical protein